ncbi:winged helix DNA-binding domain-containing protein [Wenjunlia tyrosinilytica]|uniref:Winged helix DNA-binding domain-containing protein n=1 Tax=Wenjunlia tyrosinilytica TaxID=1544741 RepID=A0A917ZQM7_9ACTN|nr:winged helix DNA-binding domain-containing protein [Wenjunlia tyrosinilytica]GGO89107.1 hypothetical protein GCM10012280_31480 [Wenjunlia tyrosinilytica]
MPEPLPLEHVRAWSLGRQGLSGQGFGGTAGCADVVGATAGTGGVYSSAPTCYLTYAARVPGFRLKDLDRALFTERSLVRFRCFHEMVYIVPAEDAGWMTAATKAATGNTRTLLKMSGQTERSYEEYASGIEAALTGREPATVPEIRAALGGREGEPGNVLSNTVALMCRQNRLVRASVRGSWTSNSHAYTTWEQWFGTQLDLPDPAASRVRLARHYLSALGPASAADLKWWAGWTVAETKAALAGLGDEAVEVVLTGEGTGDTPAWLLAEHLSEVREAPEPTGVRLLPYWDPYAMGYLRTARQRVVDDEDRARVYDKSGNGTSILLVRGRAAGVWECDFDKGVLTVHVAPLRPAAVRGRAKEIEEAAARIATMLNAEDLVVRPAPPTAPLDEGARNAFMSPIRLGAA